MAAAARRHRGQAEAPPVSRFRLVIHPEVATDIERYAATHGTTAGGLARDFMDEVDHALSRVTRFPHAHLTLYLEFRRVLMHHYPFTISFRVHEPVIFVDGIFPMNVNDQRIVDLLHRRSN